MRVCVCATDVCNSTDLPEVEIISLLEEQLPHYQLRADTIYGYDHDDWLHTPLISPDVNIDLTVEQIEETLKYFRKSRPLFCLPLSIVLSLSLSFFHTPNPLVV